MKCINCRKHFTISEFRGKVGLALCPHCLTLNTNKKMQVDIEKEKNKVFLDSKYLKLTKDEKLTILNLVKNWIANEIKILITQKYKDAKK